MAASRDGEPVHKVVVEKNVAMCTRGGVALKDDVYRQDASGKFPVLMARTPYGAEREGLLSGGVVKQLPAFRPQSEHRACV